MIFLAAIRFASFKQSVTGLNVSYCTSSIVHSMKFCFFTKLYAESNGKLPHLFIPSKTVILVPEFAVEDLPLGRTAAMVPKFAVKDLPLGRTLWLWWWWRRRQNYKSRLYICLFHGRSIEVLIVKKRTMKISFENILQSVFRVLVIGCKMANRPQYYAFIISRVRYATLLSKNDMHAVKPILQA